MTTKPNATIHIRDFSTAFQQMASFAVISDNKNFNDTLKLVILQSLVILAEDQVKDSQQIRENLSILFGLDVSILQVSAALEELIDSHRVKKSDDSNLYIPLDLRTELQHKIDQSRNLESKVKMQWFEELSLAYPLLDTQILWKCLQAYLSTIFRMHGLQAVALIDPAILNEDDDNDGLSKILREKVRSQIDKEYWNIAISAISSFLANVGKHTERSTYIAQLADGAFSYFALTVDPIIANRFKSNLSELILFLDTNFLFALLDIHVSPQVEASNQLINTVREHNFPFRLRYHQATKREFENTVVNITDRLKNYRWTRSLSRSALNSRYLTGVELKFHQLNADHGIDLDTFMVRFSHAEVILNNQGIDIYRTNSNRISERANLVKEYIEFLKRRGTEKREDAIEHDMNVLDTVRAIRSDKTSSLDAGSLLVTCDYNLYKFDWEYSKKTSTLPCAVLPNSFWQTLRPFIPSKLDFDRTFAETFAIPEFRTIRSGTAAASSRLMGLLSTYRGLPEETATRLLSNDTLIISLRNIRDDRKFQELVDVAIITENDLLREEKIALEKRVEDEIARNRILNDQFNQTKQQVLQISKSSTEQIDSIKLSVIKAELDTEKALELAKQESLAKDNASRIAETERQQRLQAEAERSSARQSQIVLEQRLHQIEIDKIRAEKTNFYFSIILAVVFSILSCWAFLWSTNNWPPISEFLLMHPNSYGIKVCVCGILISIILSIFRPNWWKWCLGVSAIGFVFVLAQILGGPSPTK